MLLDLLVIWIQLLRASSNIEKTNKIMIPFDISNKKKTELITRVYCGNFFWRI